MSPTSPAGARPRTGPMRCAGARHFASSWTAPTGPANRRPERRGISTTTSLTGDHSAQRCRHRWRADDQGADTAINLPPTTIAHASPRRRGVPRVSHPDHADRSARPPRRVETSLPTGRSDWCRAHRRCGSIAPTICRGHRSGIGTAPPFACAKTTMQQNPRRVLPRRGAEPGADPTGTTRHRPPSPRTPRR